MSIRNFVSICMAAIVLFLVLLSVILLMDNWKYYRSADDAGNIVTVLGSLTKITENLAPERGATSVALDDVAARKTLEETRGRVDRAFDQAAAVTGTLSLPQIVEVARRMEQVRAELRRWREQADAVMGRPPAEIAAFREKFLPAMYEMLNLIGRSNANLERDLVNLDADVASLAQLAGTTWGLRDYAGRLSTMHIVALTSGKPFSAEGWREINIAEGRVRQLWDELMGKAGAADSLPALREGIAKIQANFFTPFRPLQERVAKAGLSDGVYDLTPAEWRRQTAPMLSSIMVMRDVAVAEAQRAAEANRSHALRNLILTAFLLLAATATLIGSVIAINRRVVLPLAALTTTIDAFAAGSRDFVVPHAGRSDEIGRMAQAIEILRSKACEADENARREAAATKVRDQRRQHIEGVTTGFVESIDSVVEGVTNAVEGLRQATETLLATSTTTTEQSGVAAAAAGNASANVQTVAAAAEELTHSIQEISRRVAETAQAMDGAVRQAEDTNTTVRTLAEGARRIGAVVALINNIAAQTNLLALNATIEAARAGDAGKGFAVVAGEVKALANQTARATEEIQAQVAAIQGDTERAVTAIAGITSTIGTVNQYTVTIASAVEQQGAATQEIARNVQQAAAGTDEVTQSIARVLEAERDTSNAANQLSQLADQLAGASGRLRTDVRGFVSEVRAG